MKMPTVCEQGEQGAFPYFPEIDVKETGKRIRDLRIRRGCSAVILAKYLRLSSTRSIYYWQSGKALPSIDSLYAMSKLFDVSINEILVEKNVGQYLRFLPSQNCIT